MSRGARKTTPFSRGGSHSAGGSHVWLKLSIQHGERFPIESRSDFADIMQPALAISAEEKGAEILPRAGRLPCISGNHKLIFLVNFHFQPFSGARSHV